MKKHMQDYQPFDKYFSAKTLYVAYTKESTDYMEKCFTADAMLLYKEAYNKVLGGPAKSRMYWYLHRRNLV